MEASWLTSFGDFVKTFSSGFIIAGVGTYAWMKLRPHRPTREQKILRKTYLKAAARLTGNEWEEARKLFTDIAKMDTDAMDAYFVLGNILRKVGDWKGSTNVYKNLLLRPGVDDDSKARLLFELGFNQWETGFRGEALETLDEAVKLNPGWAKPRLQLVKWRLFRKEYGKAALQQEHVNRIQPDSNVGTKNVVGRIYAMQAMADADVGSLDTARFALKRAKAELGSHAHAFHAEAVVAFASGKMDDAAEAFKKAMDIDPACIPLVAWDWLERLDRTGNKAALDRWIQSKQDMGDNRWITLLKARRLLDNGQQEEAKALMNGYLLKHRHDPYAWELAKEVGFEPAEPRPRWRCKGCGVKTEAPLWYCNECDRWDSYL